MCSERSQSQVNHPDGLESNVAESTLSQTETHDKWVSEYRNPQNQKFYNLAFDRIADIVNPGADTKILDAGCGSATKSIHLAKRSFNVTGVDLADAVLEKANKAIHSENLQDKITLKQENLTSLSFDSESFDQVLCWGVLMHIPDVEKAIKELCRVTKSDGHIIISEGNLNSIQSILLRSLKRLLGRNRARVEKTNAGIEYWEETPVGDLMTRQTNMHWLVQQFSKHDAILQKRMAGQLSEMYIMDLPAWVKSTIHTVNNFWFKYIKLPGPAFGNLFIFRKK